MEADLFVWLGWGEPGAVFVMPGVGWEAYVGMEGDEREEEEQEEGC